MMWGKGILAEEGRKNQVPSTGRGGRVKNVLGKKDRSSEKKQINVFSKKRGKGEKRNSKEERIT